MYRRIQLINHFQGEKGSLSNRINGMMGTTTAQVMSSWAWMNAARKGVGKNFRFYFTEKGWEDFGRQVVAACRGSGQQYRVMAVRERDVDVLYQDEWQVMVSLHKSRSRRGS